MALINDLLNAGGNVVRTIGGGINYAASAFIRPPVQTIVPVIQQAPRVIGQVAAPFVQQGIRTAGQVGQAFVRPPVQTIVPAIQQAPRVIGQVAAPFVQQAPRVIGRTAAPFVQQGIKTVGQVGQVLTRSPVSVLAPVIQQAPRVIGRTAAPFVQQGIRTAGQVGQVLTRSPVSVLAPVIQQAPRLIGQVAAPFVQQAPRVIGRTAAPFAAAIISPGVGIGMLTGQVLAPARRVKAPSLGMNIAGLQSGNVQQAQRLIQTTNSVTGSYGIQPIDLPGGQVQQQSSSWQRNLANGFSWGTLSNWSVKTPAQSSSFSIQSPTQSTARSSQGSMDVFGAINRGDLFGAIGAAGNVLGSLRPASGTQVAGPKQWNNQSWQSNITGPDGRTTTMFGTNSSWTQNTTAQRPAPVVDPRDGSTDWLGKLRGGDVIGAVGAGGKWLLTNVPPAAEGASNWWSNVVISGLNTGQFGTNKFGGGIGALERGEYLVARQFDSWVTSLRRPAPAQGSLGFTAYQASKGAGTFAGLGSTSRVLANDLIGGIGTGVLLGIAGTTRFAGDIGGKLWNRDVTGAAGTALTGGANFAIGTAQWGLGIPGRIAANPQRGTAQVLGEFVAGDLLFRGAGGAVRGAKGITVQTIGRPLGLFNPDVLVTSGKRFGVPQDAPMRQVESILTNPVSYNVIHTSRQPLSLNPFGGKIFAEPGEGAAVPKQFATYGNRQVGVTSDIFFTRKLKDLPISVRASNLFFGPRINVVPQMRNVQLPSNLRSTALHEVRTRGALTESTYRQIEGHALEQSTRYGEPIFMPSPKRMKPQISRIENEGIAVFGSDAARTISTSRFGGYTSGGVRVTQIAFGNQALAGSMVSTLARNARSSFDLGFSRHAGITNLGLYHRPTVGYFTGLANYKMNVLTGRRQVSPQEAQYDGFGIDHVRQVEAGLMWARRQNPVIGAHLSPTGARIMALTGDAGKFWAQDPTYPSGRLAAIGLEKGLFPAISRDFSRLPKSEQNVITRSLRQHDMISPTGLRGIKTRIVDRPDAVGMALFNADQPAGAALFSTAAMRRRGVGSRFQSPAGIIEPGLSRMMTRSRIARGGRETIGDWGASSIHHNGRIFRSSSRWGGKTREVSGARDVSLTRRSNVYEPRREGRSNYGGYARKGGYSLSIGYVSSGLGSGPSLLSYAGEKSSYRRSYAPKSGGISELFQDYGRDLSGGGSRYLGGYRNGYTERGGDYITGGGGYGGNGYGGRYTGGGGGYGGYRYGGRYTGGGGYGGYGYGGRYTGGGGGYGGYGYGGRYTGGGGYGGYGYGGRYTGGGGYGGYGYGGRYTGGGGGYGGYGYGGRYTGGGGGGYITTSTSIITGGGGDTVTTGGWYKRTGTLVPERNTPGPGEGNAGRRGGGRAAYDFTETLGIKDPMAILSSGGRPKRRKKGKSLFVGIKLPKLLGSSSKKPRSKVRPSRRRRK